MTLDAVDWPPSWRVRPLWSLFRRVKDVCHPEEQMLSVYRDHGVVVKDDRTDNFNKTAENRNIYQLIDRGWLVVNRMKAWQGSVGISAHRGIVSGHYLCFEPQHDEDNRFLSYLLRSDVYAAEFRRLSRGVRPAQIEIDNDWLRSLQVHVPDLPTQAAIVTFLDAETARIDDMVEAKRLQVAALDERSVAVRAAWYDGAGGGKTVSLRRLGAHVEQGWSPQCDPEAALPSEWGVLKTSAVSSGRFLPEENKKLPESIGPDLRWQARTGDLLVVRGSGSVGSVGMCAVAEPGDRLLTISDLVYRVRGLAGCPAYYADALTARQVRLTIESSLRTDAGQTLKLRSDDVRDLRVPLVRPDQQYQVWRNLDDALEPMREGKRTLLTQIELLAERRRALITIAVMGELVVA